MRKLTERQKNLCVGVAVVAAAIAGVLIVLRVAHVTTLPLFIPLLLFLTAAALFAAARGLMAQSD